MRKSYFIAAITMAMVVMAAVAVAETVDIGLGSMDKAEFDTLRQMVNGEFQPGTRLSTEKPLQTRVAEFYQADVEAIRLAMVNTSDRGPATAFTSGDQLVDIGTGSMATNEFCDLNKLVASNSTNLTSGFNFICP